MMDVKFALSPSTPTAHPTLGKSSSFMPQAATPTVISEKSLPNADYAPDPPKNTPPEPPSPSTLSATSSPNATTAATSPTKPRNIPDATRRSSPKNSTTKYNTYSPPIFTGDHADASTTTTTSKDASGVIAANGASSSPKAKATAAPTSTSSAWDAANTANATF